MDLMTRRIRELFRNYISTSALSWYFKGPHIQSCVDLFLGLDAQYELRQAVRQAPTACHLAALPSAGAQSPEPG